MTAPKIAGAPPKRQNHREKSPRREAFNSVIAKFCHGRGVTPEQRDRAVATYFRSAWFRDALQLEWALYKRGPHYAGQERPWLLGEIERLQSAALPN